MTCRQLESGDSRRAIFDIELDSEFSLHHAWSYQMVSELELGVVYVYIETYGTWCSFQSITTALQTHHTVYTYELYLIMIIIQYICSIIELNWTIQWSIGNAIQETYHRYPMTHDTKYGCATTSAPTHSWDHTSRAVQKLVSDTRINHLSGRFDASGLGFGIGAFYGAWWFHDVSWPAFYLQKSD